jgi:DNA-binding MarR family transcriptional regulator
MNDKSVKSKVNTRISKSCGLAIFALSHEISQYFNNNLREYGLTGSQLTVINYLWINKDIEVNQKMIECEMHVKSSSTTSILVNLEKQGLILRTVDPEDRRNKFVTLTKTGNLANAIFTEKIDEIEKKLTTGMTKEEKMIFMKGLLRALRNFDFEV